MGCTLQFVSNIHVNDTCNKCGESSMLTGYYDCPLCNVNYCQTCAKEITAEYR